MSTVRYAAFLRAIANVPMEPFRSALLELGLTDVRSFGMSGNFVFSSDHDDVGRIEEVIGQRFGTPAMVRRGPELARIVERGPFDGPAASIMLLARAPTPAVRKKFTSIKFEEPGARIDGRSIYFTYPLVKQGLKSHADLERELGMIGTARAMSVVRRVAELSAD